MVDKPTLIYWDACMFYEVLANEPVSAGKKAAMGEIIAGNEKGDNHIITSVITHLEVLPAKLDHKGVDDESDYLAQFDAKKMSAIEINTNILLRAREIRDYYYQPPDATGGYKMMDLGDCIHLATASIYQVHEMHTRDNDNKGPKVPLLKLYEVSGNPKLCGKYDLKISSPESRQGSLDLPPPKGA